MATLGSTEAEARIQVLDMDEYFSGDVGRVSKFCEHVRELCHTVGFFYVKNHRVPQELCDSFLQLGREFFNLPSETKMQLDYRNSAQFRGYMKVGVESTGGITDFREQLDLGPEEAEHFDIIDGKAQKLVYPVYRRLRGPNLWPPEHLLPNFKTKAEEFVDRMGALSMHLMQAIALSLGLRKDYFDSTFQNSPHYQMKVVRYPPKSENEDAESLGMFGVGEHSDSGFLSLLLQDAVGGLQARTNAGEWTDVPPKLGTFVVNLGEMLQLATGGYYLATVHRVQSQSGSTSRYSVPFFFNPRLDTDITTLNMVSNSNENGVSVQDVSPFLVQDTLLCKHSTTHGGANKLLPVFGQNTFKSFARSHPINMREHHPDLLQADGKFKLSTLEETSDDGKHPNGS
ncbi:unnamed protein product [Calypogeia fissa]